MVSLNYESRKHLILTRKQEINANMTKSGKSVELNEKLPVMIFEISSKVAPSRFAYPKKFSQTFSSWSFVIRVNLVHP